MLESPTWTTEMAHLIRVFATKSDDLSWTPGTQILERENHPFSCPLISAIATLPIPPHPTPTLNKCKDKKRTSHILLVTFPYYHGLSNICGIRFGSASGFFPFKYCW